MTYEINKVTPRPWVVETVPTSIGRCHKIGPFPGNHTHKDNSACIYEDNTSGTNHEELRANAAHIVHCVNHYDAFERALIGLLRVVECSAANVYDNSKICKEARALLEKVRP